MTLLNRHTDIRNDEKFCPGTGQVVDVIGGFFPRRYAEGFDVDLTQGRVFGPLLEGEYHLAGVLTHQLLYLDIN